MADATQRLQAMLRSEAVAAQDAASEDEARLLRRLAATTQDMTPSERRWVEEASEEEMRGFARALRMGCAREPQS